MTTDTVIVDSKGKATVIKDPDATLDYVFDWTDWLDLINDEIAVSPAPTFTFTNGVTLSSMSRNGTRGTGRNYKTDSTGYAVGATNISLSNGTGSILTGDVVKFDGDDTLYPVSGFSGGILTLPVPGLKQAIPAAATAVSVRALVVAFLSGGTVKTTATATCHVQTVGGRIEDRTLNLKIKER
jgi:hypothetical protein